MPRLPKSYLELFKEDLIQLAYNPTEYKKADKYYNLIIK